MSGAVRPRTRVVRFLIVVIIFALLGPLVGGIAVWAASTAYAVSIGAVPAEQLPLLFVTLTLIVFGAYPTGIYFALAAGIIVGAAGIWGRWNGLPVPVIAAAIASLLVWLPTSLSLAPRWGEPKLAVTFLICLLASIVCWFAVRGIVRSTWPPAS